MNWKKLILLGCVLAVIAASTATAQMRGRGHSMGGMGMRGAFMPRSMRGMPMHRGPLMNSPSGFRRFGGRGFARDGRFRRFNRFNDHDFDRDDRFHHFHHFNEVIFIGDFGFPWWWGWGWGPWWGGGWGWGYPYGYYGGYNYGDYGSGYGYGDSSQSRVAELQRRLARAGYYSGAIDGILGPRTRQAIRAYERDHAYGAIDQRLLFENRNKA